jgi:hypothetical protein
MNEPRCIGGIGHLQVFEEGHLCDVFVTTGAIEKVSHGSADDRSFAATAKSFEEIARRKLKETPGEHDRIWIRSLDVPEGI